MTTNTPINKSELIDHMAEQADIPKSAATKALNGFIEAISAALCDGKVVSLLNFGTFSVKERAARTGRNPKTGEPLQIAASKVPQFKAGKALKDAVNSGSVVVED